MTDALVSDVTRITILAYIFLSSLTLLKILFHVSRYHYHGVQAIKLAKRGGVSMMQTHQNYREGHLRQVKVTVFYALPSLSLMALVVLVLLWIATSGGLL